VYVVEILGKSPVYKPQMRSPLLRLKVDFNGEMPGFSAASAESHPPGESYPAIGYDFGDDSDRDVAAADLHPKRSADLDLQNVRNPEPLRHERGIDQKREHRLRFRLDENGAFNRSRFF
jgi:hypothetical protein